MNDEVISKAVKTLQNGGLIIYPTETCYGLGADATNPAAIKKVFIIKNRPFTKPLSVIVSSIEMIKEYAVITRETEQLIKEYMPGPLTLIVKNKTFPKILLGDETRVGFRIPDHLIALEIVKKLGRPITATSANISSQPNNYEVPDLPVDYVINQGKLPLRQPSTVYDTIIKKTIREGPVKIINPF